MIAVANEIGVSIRTTGCSDHDCGEAIPAFVSLLPYHLIQPCFHDRGFLKSLFGWFTRILGYVRGKLGFHAKLADGVGGVGFPEVAALIEVVEVAIAVSILYKPATNSVYGRICVSNTGHDILSVFGLIKSDS